MSKRHTELVRQLELAEAKIKTALHDPELKGMSSEIVMVALMGVAVEIALLNGTPDDVRDSMIEMINHGFSDPEYPTVQ